MSFTAEAVRNEMRQHVSAIIALAPEDNRKASFSFAAFVLKLPISRVKCLFYGEARRVEAHEADKIRAYVTAAQKLIEARAKFEALRAEYVATAHPALTRFAPRELDADEISQAAQDAAVKGR